MTSAVSAEGLVLCNLGVGVEPPELLPVVFLEFAQDDGVEVALFALDVLAQEADQVSSQGQQLAELAGGVEVEELAAELVESLPDLLDLRFRGC